MQARDMREKRFVGIAVVLDSADPPADGNADDKVQRQLLVPSSRHPGGLRDDLIHRRVDEAFELNLADRFESAQRHADGLPDDR